MEVLRVSRYSAAVELEKQRALDEVLENCGGQLRYVDVARKIQDHPAFAGVKLAILQNYVRVNVLRKNGHQPKGKSVLYNGHKEKPVCGSGFDLIKNSIRFRNGVNFEEIGWIGDAVEQIRPFYERLETENREAHLRLEATASKTTAAELRSAETRCHDCETYRAECDAKVSKVNGDNAQLVAKIHEQENWLSQMRDRLRKNALAV